MKCTVLGVAAIGCLAGALPATAVAQQAATITGRITDAATGQPVPSAQVTVVGTNLGAMTNEQGRYTVRGVPARQVSVRVLRVGYAEQTQAVTATSGGSATADFALRAVSVSLTPVVTTATGETRRVEVGNAIAQIDAGRVIESAPIRNVTDLLTARAPGVQVVSGGYLGGGARVRIRGSTSLSLSNDPIYIIDGVRMTSNTGNSSLGVGGTLPSRAQDINPDEIENIEVVKGPSAATLYGTDAANGVIVITTKRGRAGQTRFNAYVEQGLIKDRNDYPDNYTLFGHTAAAPNTPIRCSLPQVASGACIRDSLATFNVMETPDVTPLATGHRQQYGLNISGGTEAVRFFTSAEYEGEVGTLETPAFQRRRYAAQNIPILGTELRPNALNRSSFRANLNASPWRQFDIALNTNYINQNQRLPQTDDNVTGIFFNAIGGPGVRDTAGLNGYKSYEPGRIFQAFTGQTINRFLGSTNMNWRPTTWWSNRANIGIDYTGRVDSDLCRRGNCAQFSTIPQGYADNNRANLRNVTVDIGSTASYAPLAWLSAKTTAGAQYVNYRFDRNQAFSSILTPGAQTVSGGSIKGAGESTDISKTVGVFIQEELAARDRLFLTGALRSDQNSAFGTDFQRVVYPKLSLSYVLSEEGFFPKFGWLSQFRLRSAYGASGTQPGPNDAQRYFSASTANFSGSDQPTLLFSALGNTKLKPERATEFEGGFDTRLFNSRVNLELTYYSKVTRDALISQVIPPTVGSGNTGRFVNLGSVKNAGLEALLGAQVVDTRRLGLDVTLNGSTNANKLVTMGQGIPPIIGTIISQKPGYPLNAYWGRPILGYEDKNGDHIISYSSNAATNELFVGDTAVYLGYSTPRHEASLTSGLELFGRALRVQALFDYKGGQKLLNNTERFRCDNHQNCRGRNDPSASLAEQAAAVARTVHPSGTWAGFVEDADFVRFRELSLTYKPSAGLARLIRAQNTSLSLSARNLHTWTKYSGMDPETNYNTNADAPVDFFTMPPQTYVTLRVNVGF